jgi:hypothetical protein
MDVPFEFVGEFASASERVEAGDVQRRSASRHDGWLRWDVRKDCHLSTQFVEETISVMALGRGREGASSPLSKNICAIH